MLTNGNKNLNAIAITIEGNTDYNDTSWGIVMMNWVL